ncbi:MAG: Tektin-1-like [Paramarteilia canceri]
MESSEQSNAQISVPGWQYSNWLQMQNCAAEADKVERALINAELAIKKVEEERGAALASTDHQLEQRVNRIGFWKGEMESVQEVCIESQNNLHKWQEVLQKSLDNIKIPADVNTKCKDMRLQRRTSELVCDEVSRRLESESQILEKSRENICNQMECNAEQFRLSRKHINKLDK